MTTAFISGELFCQWWDTNGCKCICIYIYIFIYIHTFLQPETTSFKWMLSDTTIFHVKIWFIIQLKQAFLVDVSSSGYIYIYIHFRTRCRLCACQLQSCSACQLQFTIFAICQGARWPAGEAALGYSRWPNPRHSMGLVYLLTFGPFLWWI